MAVTANPLAKPLFCERCGAEFKQKHCRCAECRAVPTRQWLQFISLGMLLAAIGCNSAAAWLVLPRLEHARRGAELFRAWLWCDVQFAAYGWAPIVAALLAWDYWVWRRAKPREMRAKVKRWVTKRVLLFAAAAAVTPILPWWIPAGQPPRQFFAMIRFFPGNPTSSIAWIAVAFVLALLCGHRATRDSLLGHGRLLSLLSLSVLFAVLAATLAGWSLV